MTLPALFTASARLAPQPFWLGALAVYGLSFLSQMLLAPAITARSGVAPFALVQAALIYTWFALHAARLRDAGRPIGGAVGIAILYALGIVLLLLLVEAMTGANLASGNREPNGATFGTLVLVVFLIALLSADPTIGMFFYVALAIVVMIFAPLFIALAFSVATGLRRRAPAAAVP